MAMNKEELSTYKETIMQQLKQDELALERVRMQVQNQKKMVKLVDEQLKAFENEKPLV